MKTFARLRRSIRQAFCRHGFHFDDLTGRDVPGGNVRWPCRRCGKVFIEHCGLEVLRHGERIKA